MIQPVVRSATTADLETLRAIEAECFGASAWSTSLLENATSDPMQDVLLTGSDDAYGVVRVVDDTADLDRIAAMPHVRRRGVGRGLLDQLIAHAAGRGAQRMLLEVAADNTGALALYESAGFQQIHHRARYYPGGIDAVILELAIQP